MELRGGYLYASTATDVYRWKYAANRTPLGATETVITGMPTTGASTRTLTSDERHLYVSVGSETNLDAEFSRARIVRFELSSLSAVPSNFSAGELFADGLRNNVGMAFDGAGRLWGVDNGRDDLSRADLGGDIHENNPADELNLFSTPGAYYGFPFCWTQGTLPAPATTPTGTQWVDPKFMADGVHSDVWCRSPANVVVPRFSFQAHSAPLDLLFYAGTSFPSSFTAGAFVTSHGSWDRTDPTGYQLLYLPLSADGSPQAQPTTILGYEQAIIPRRCGYRPVGLTVLYQMACYYCRTTSAVSSVIAVGYSLEYSRWRGVYLAQRSPVVKPRGG